MFQREMAKLIGLLNSFDMAFLPTRRHYYHLLQWKNENLSHQLWDKKHKISQEAKDEMLWWLKNLDDWNGRMIIPQPHQIIIYTDASKTGWGASCEELQAKGYWDLETQQKSNNFKELAAIKNALLSFPERIHSKSVLVRTDNTIALAYINHMGGRIKELSDLSAEIWDFCLTKETYLQASYIPGEENVIADRLSRFKDRNDWKLNPEECQKVEVLWGPHDIDLFASKLNTQLPKFYSWMNEPDSMGTDAFQQTWNRINGYANPPFALLGRILNKVLIDEASISVLAPIWPSAYWFPMLLDMVIDHPLILPDREDLFLPGFLGNELPMNNPQWRAAVWRVSGIHSLREDFRKKCPDWYLNLGKEVQEYLTTPIGVSGLNTVDFSQ